MPKQMINPAFLRPAGAAAYASVSRRHLNNLVARGELRCARLGGKCTLFSVADLDQAIMSRMSPRLKSGAA